jgi:GMP synthase-like glutamine amidotransferase
MRFHCLQHVVFETPGAIAGWVLAQGHSLDYTHLYRGDTLPAVDEFDALVVMGGPMSVHDEKELPWLKKEKELIAAAILGKKKILGICLGAQLAAEAAGSSVSPNPMKEIGFFPVNWTKAAREWIGEGAGANAKGEPRGQGNLRGQLPAVSQIFHWHGETFGLPEGAIHLAWSEACTNQAFLLGSDILGLQFHPEAGPEIIRDMVRYEGHELVPTAYVQSAPVILGQLSGDTAVGGEILDLLLNRFFTT